MNKNGYSLLKVFVIFLFILNIILGFFFWINNANAVKSIKILKNKVQFDSIRNKNIDNSVLFMYLLEENLRNTVNWEKYLESGESYFFVLFNSHQCKSCIKEIIIDFSYLKQSTGYDRYALMGTYNDSLSFFQTADSLDGEFKHVYLFPFDDALLQYPYPVVFQLDENKDIRYFFVPDLFPEMRRWYFYTFLKSRCTIGDI